MTINSINNKNSIKIKSADVPLTRWLIATQPVDSKIAIADLNAKKRVEHEIVELKETIQKNVAEIWINYQKKFPEAFMNNARLSKTTPEVIFYSCLEDIKKKYPTVTSDGVVAFVNSGEPNKICFHTPRNFEDYKKIGLSEVKATIAHELMHSLTNNTVTRITVDLEGKKQTYKGVKNHLEQKFTLPSHGHSREIQIFTIADLLKEGSADVLSMMVTGITSKHDPYRPYRVLTKELMGMVGLKTYKKAFLENDRPSYMAVIKQALKLKEIYDAVFKKHINSNPVMPFIDKFRKENDL